MDIQIIGLKWCRVSEPYDQMVRFRMNEKIKNGEINMIALMTSRITYITASIWNIVTVPFIMRADFFNRDNARAPDLLLPASANGLIQKRYT